MKILLIRTPRMYWPFINEYDNYLLPQSLVCLAAVLRQAKYNVKILDCMPLKIGWKSLAEIIKKEKPDVIGTGDSESVYYHEAVRLLKLAKKINPKIITVTGGAHFSNLYEECLQQLPLDFVVRGEGEYSFLNLIKELEKTNPNFNKVCGIAFKENGKVIRTPAQSLIKNLDDLPLPAYDLMPLHLYGKAKFIFDPGGITLHHSRGCIDSCKFCVWWVQMSEEKIIDGKVVNIPRWRTKSVPKMIEEIKLLVYKYNRRGFVFVDDSWNISKQWNEKFAEEVIKQNIKFNWFAFMRADCIVRDEKAGVLKKLVQAGLKHVCIGVERGSNQELNSMNKPFYSTDIVKECFSILKNKYPEVFRQATFIVGIRDESKKTMLAQAKYAKEIQADYPGFHPMTPVPGTKYWEEAKREGYLEITDFKFYDWCTPVISTKYLKREEVEQLMYTLNKKFTTPLWLIKGLFSRYAYKRKMYIWWLLVFLRVFFRNLLQLVNPLDWDKITGLVKPKWYEK